MANHTVSFDLPPLPSYALLPAPNLIPGLADAHLTTILLIVVYWVWSMIFHIFDEFDLFPQYRLHTPAEVLKRNHVSRFEVVKDVLVQQAVQAAFGVALTFIDPIPMVGKEDYDVAWYAQRIRITQRAIPTVLGLLGLDAGGLARTLHGSHAVLAGAVSGGVYPQFTQTIILAGEPVAAPAFAEWEVWTAKCIYHGLIPALQLMGAICILDTWQYFLHRAMHLNKWLYTTFHSRHHRLYVPYAYGALYNHPFEGFLLDTLGSGLAYLLTGMSVRQGMVFFVLATLKTVDDHCGYNFPWDPLQHLTGNNAGYHDVHHQSWGIKTNFSQPFLTFWDTLLGTKWTGGDVSARYQRAKIAAQKKVDADRRTVTGSQACESTQAGLKPYSNEAAQATSAARAAQVITEPRIPPGRAEQQAIDGRQQVLDDQQGGGMQVLAEETVEEVQERHQVKRKSRRRTTSSGLKGFADKVGVALHGKSSGVLHVGVESGSR